MVHTIRPAIALFSGTGKCSRRFRLGRVKPHPSIGSHDQIYASAEPAFQSDLQGVDYLSRADRGSMLIDYLGVSERQLVKATERMIADGKYELAATVLEWTKGRFAGSTSLADVERLTYLKLMEKYQEFDPFKFIIYAGKIGDQTPQMEAKEQTPRSGIATHAGQ
jgi:hypothetical protein